MKGTCKLFDIETDLKESHIIPKFIFDYTKKTGSKYLRGFETPNKRLQDGVKKYLLSEKAEQQFSNYEKWFAENIYYPYLIEDKRYFQYNEKLYYFAVSLLWRVLLEQIEHPIIKEKPYINKLQEVCNEWKEFLKNFTFPINFSKINLFLTDHIESHNIETNGVDYYFTRMIDATIVSNKNDTYLVVYCKFNKFVFWSTIYSYENPIMKDVEIKLIGGNMKIPQEFNDAPLADFFSNRIKQIETLQKPSEKQQEKILEEIRKDMSGFLNSEAGKAIYNDIFKFNKSK